MNNEIHFGDCRASMRKMAAAGIKVQTCVTSPPYFRLRDYGHAGQIGLEQTPEAYIAELVEVFRCVREVLAGDGTCFINIGDSYFGAGARRAAPCGTSCKEPASSPKSDCLCGSLCDACRKAYQIGKSRSGSLRAPMLAPSQSESIPEHTESVIDRPPTSGSDSPAGRISCATQDQQQASQCQPVVLRDVPASTTAESFQQPQDECSQGPRQADECLLCERSLQGCAPLFERMVECSCDTSQHESVSGNRDKGVLDLAYQYPTTTSLKPKDLIGIPWMLAFALRADGWYLRQDIIWHKPNPMPESVTDRCTKAHEYVFLLSKSPVYFYDADAVKEPASAEYAKKGRARKPDKVLEGAGFEIRGGLGNQAPSETRNRRSVWTIATKPYKGAHFAVFPSALVEPCVLAGSRPGDVVLDPFMGSGTTAAVAIEHGRQFIGCELNDTYKPLQDERIQNARLAVKEKLDDEKRRSAQMDIFQEIAA